MRDFLLDYHPIHPTTWVYLSSLLMIGVFFKFSRLWSMRNLDLILLVLLAPGLLLVTFGNESEQREQGQTAAGVVQPLADRLLAPQLGGTSPEGPLEAQDAARGDLITETEPRSVESGGLQVAAAAIDDQEANGRATGSEQSAIPGRRIQYYGYLWLLAVCGLLMLRLLIDPTMVRRPLLEPNLSSGGLTFLGCSLFVFLMANVVNSPTTEDDLKGPRGARQLLTRESDESNSDDLQRHGPGNAVLHLLPSLVSLPQQWSEPSGEDSKTELGYVRTAKAMAILSHLAVVFGIIAIGYRHFDNIQMGIGAATLYLMLPYTSQMTGRVDHVLPAALLVWAVLSYRRPLAAGMFIGLAIGVVYYPLFLLPLWISFYWERGLMRFITGFLITLSLMALSLLFVSPDLAGFLANVQKMFGIWFPVMERLRGIWGLGWDPIYRLPVLAAFIAISGAMALWPAQKNLGTLLSCTAAVMVATQFWHGFGGGLYLAWSLPLALLTIFRPNLEDRVASTVLGEGWFPRRRHSLAA